MRPVPPAVVQAAREVFPAQVKRDSQRTGEGVSLKGVWSGEKIGRFQRRLLEWYRKHKRELPWRSRPSPYRVWISEIMLQQTQVRTVLPFYERFLERFPDVRTLAEAAEAEVLASWAGLGYYSRARNLRRAAQKILQDSQGRFPQRMEEMLKLPGIGRYTAGAICAIAFNQPQPVVDSNVKRVIVRLHGIAKGVPESYFWERAASWVHAERNSDFSQAVMELGALVCVHSRPLCRMCPVASFCEARLKGIQDRIPAPRAGRPAQEIELAILVPARAGQVLITSERTVPFIPGEWGFPLKEIGGIESPLEAARELSRCVCAQSPDLRACGVVRHGITHRRILVHVFSAQLDSATRQRGSRSRWIGVEELDSYITSSLFKKAFRSVFPDA